MIAGLSQTPLVWPLLDKLRRPTAAQVRPKAYANQGVTRIPVRPWDDSDRPGYPWFGQVEKTPILWETAPWQFGLAKLGVQSKRLVEFSNNPRTLVVSEEIRVPSVIKPLITSLPVLPPGPAQPSYAKRSVLVWPLRTKLFDPAQIVRGAPINATSKPAVPGMMTLQQNPKSGPLVVPPKSPLNRVRIVNPKVVHSLPLPARTASISGLTKDNTGAVLGNCVVELYLTATNEALAQTTSDANGVFYFQNVARFSPATHYLVAYKAGSPDVAGTTLNTLTAIG